MIFSYIIKQILIQPIFSKNKMCSIEVFDKDKLDENKNASFSEIQKS